MKEVIAAPKKRPKRKKTVLLSSEQETQIFTMMYHANRFIFLNILANDAACLAHCQNHISSWLGQGKNEKIAVSPPPYACAIDPAFFSPEVRTFFETYHIFRQPLWELIDLFCANPQNSNEMKILITKAKAAVEEKEHLLLKFNENLVLVRVGKKLNDSRSKEDLISHGCMGFLRAIWKYDVFRLNPETQTPYKLSTSATNWIDRELQLAIYRDTSPIGIRTPDYLKPIIAALHQAKEEFAQKNITPSIKQLHDYVAESIKKHKLSSSEFFTEKRLMRSIEYLLQVSDGMAASLDYVIGNEENDTLLNVLIVDVESSRNEQQAWLDEIEDLSKDIAGLKVLSAWDWKVVKMNLGIGMNGYSLQPYEIAELLNCSPQLIYSTLKSSFDKLRNYLEQNQTKAIKS